MRLSGLSSEVAALGSLRFPSYPFERLRWEALEPTAGLSGAASNASPGCRRAEQEAALGPPPLQPRKAPSPRAEALERVETSAAGASKRRLKSGEGGEN